MNAPVLSKNFTRVHKGKQSFDIPLVDVRSTADGSQAYVLQLIMVLQSFYRRRNFSHRERFGSPDPVSEQVLEDLARALEQTKQLIQQARDSSTPLMIESSIKMELSPAKQG